MTDSRAPFARSNRDRLTHWLLLLLILVAFGRLVWRLDAKSLWWDESLSLQRAESPWPELLTGRITLNDGVTEVPTTDQHPFAYFALLGTLIRLTGESEFTLRLPSVAAATLLIPMLWAFARLLVRRSLLPPASPLWAALFATANPFFLWYGREARMYIMVSFLALLSTYLLMRWREVHPGPMARGFFVAYLLVLIALLSSHYLAVLLLPIHAGLLLSHFWPLERRRAVAVGGGLLALGLAYGVVAGLVILNSPGSGSNFSSVSLGVMAADLLNAFSLGLSVDIAQVRWLDYVFGMVALVGALWCWRSKETRPRDAWLLPAFLILPIMSLQVVQIVQPAYMNARHMSLVSGVFVLLIGGGVAAIWGWRAWLGAVLVTVLIAGSVYSSINYFGSPLYAKDDFAEVGADLDREIQPGDAVVLVPPQMLRLYRYYLPIDRGQQVAWLGAPLFDAPREANEAQFRDLLHQYRRVWLVLSGMVPFSVATDAVEDWFRSNAWLARDSGYPSNTGLRLELFLRQAPVVASTPETVSYPVDIVFGDQVRLDGYDVGLPLAPDHALPITLYWQAVRPMDRRYKYVLRLQSEDGTGGLETLGITEREPYDGHLPTTQWQPGQTVVEYSGLASATRDGIVGRPRLTLEVYDAETLEKLAVTRADGGELLDGGQTVLLPYEP